MSFFIYSDRIHEPLPSAECGELTVNRVKARTDSLLEVLIKKVQVRTCDVPHDVDTQLTLYKHNNVCL